MTVDEIMAKHRASGIQRSSILMFDQSSAMALIKDAQHEGLELGLIDAFFLTESTTQPSMADSIDFLTYGTPDGSESFEYATKLVGDSSRSNMYFEVILCAPHQD